MNKELVVFDFDGTLTKRDSFIEFIKFSKGKTMFYLTIPIIGFVWLISKLKLITTHTAKEYIFSFYFKGMSITEFDKHCNRFINVIDTMLRDDAKTVIENHIKNQAKVCIVSASIENWIKPWALSHNIKTVIATQIELYDARNLTGKFRSQNCNGKEKVNRLVKEISNIKDYNLTVYGDTNGDKAMMEMANKVYYRTLI